MRYMSRATPRHLPEMTRRRSTSKSLVVMSRKARASKACWADVVPAPDSLMVHWAPYKLSSLSLRGFVVPPSRNSLHKRHNDPACSSTIQDVVDTSPNLSRQWILKQNVPQFGQSHTPDVLVWQLCPDLLEVQVDYGRWLRPSTRSCISFRHKL